jgi:starch phosphorylase
VTGWAIGQNGRGTDGRADRSKDAASLNDKLERVVMPTFDQDRDRFIDVMRRVIALNGSFFNTQRLMQQCVLWAYFE